MLKLSWGVAPGYGEYRRWRKDRRAQLDDEHNVGSAWPTAMFNIARGIAPGAPTAHFGLSGLGSLICRASPGRCPGLSH